MRIRPPYTRIALVTVGCLFISAVVTAQPTASGKKYFRCPATFQVTAGWQSNDHDCGTDVIPPVAVYIRATNDDGTRENLYGLCCYAEGRSLLRRASPDFAVAEPDWKRLPAPSAVTNRHIFRHVCCKGYTGVDLADCKFQELDLPPATLSPQMQLGFGVFTAHCANCHKSDGMGMPPILPALKGDSVATGPADEMIQTVLSGVPGTIMLSFGGNQPDDPLSDEQLAAVITYVRNTWGNDDKKKHGEHAGGVITAGDVARVRSAHR